MKVKAKDLVTIDVVVAAYAKLKGFPGEDGKENRKQDFEAKYRASRLFRSVQLSVEPIFESRSAIVEEFYEPAGPQDVPGTPRKLKPGKTQKKLDEAFKAFYDAEHDVDLHALKWIDLTHPEVTGEMISVFESCGVITGTPPGIQEIEPEKPNKGE